jgi:hypothetical protein
MPWILNEDAALTSKLRGIRVTDTNASAAGREVPVLWVGPEVEVQPISYPYIGIESLGWFRDPSREHRGYIQLPYAPEGYPTWWDDTAANPSFIPGDSPYRAWFPIPYNFDYQITVFARFEREHLIPIVSALAGVDYLHPHFAYLDIPQDGTVRTMLLNAGPEKGVAHDDHNKRIATATYNIRVCSELLGTIDAPSQFGGSMVLAKQLNLDLSVYSDITDPTSESTQEQAAILSVGMLSGWNTQ